MQNQTNNITFYNIEGSEIETIYQACINYIPILKTLAKALPGSHYKINLSITENLADKFYKKDNKSHMQKTFKLSLKIYEAFVLIEILQQYKTDAKNKVKKAIAGNLQMYLKIKTNKIQLSQ